MPSSIGSRLFSKSESLVLVRRVLGRAPVRLAILGAAIVLLHFTDAIASSATEGTTNKCAFAGFA